MDSFRIWFFALFTIKLLAVNGVGAEKQFILIAPNAVLANKAMAAELKSLTWQKADGTWVPATAEALTAMKHLKSTEGTMEILACAGPDTRMDVSLKRIDSSHYQVFGLVIDGQRKILLEATPIQSSFDRFLPELWRKEIISVRVLDGGAGYWWALYDVNSGRFVSSNRRPDS